MLKLQRPVPLKPNYLQEGQPYLVSQKHDGIRGVWLNGTLVSRQGKPLPNPHIQAVLTSWNLPDGTDMEICCRDATGQVTLKAAQRAVMSRTPAPDFEAYAFANVYDTWLPTHPIPGFHVVTQHPVTTLQQVLNFHEQVACIGGEGIVVKQDLPYAEAESFKLKPHYVL